MTLEEFIKEELGLSTHKMASGDYQSFGASIAAKTYEHFAGAGLAVWYGKMPESNGKTNWTAILHRKGEGIMDGPHITIERSEYPDRVRYEADRVRHIIGELAEDPDILAYDPDLHSGYKRPAPPKAIFEKQYVADGISDIWRDTSEMLDERMNPAAAEIPKDEHGFHTGTFKLTLTWTPDE